jgi:hypothetical protein
VYALFDLYDFKLTYASQESTNLIFPRADLFASAVYLSSSDEEDDIPVAQLYSRNTPPVLAYSSEDEEDVPIAHLYPHTNFVAPAHYLRINSQTIQRGVFVLLRGHPFLPDCRGVNPDQYNMVFMLGRVLSEVPFYASEFRVHFFVTTDASANGSWRGLFNENKRRWEGYVERSSVLLWRITLTRTMKLSSVNKMQIALHPDIPEYNAVLQNNLVATML